MTDKKNTFGVTKADHEMILNIEAGSPVMDRKRRTIMDVVGAVIGATDNEESIAWFQTCRYRVPDGAIERDLVRVVSDDEDVLWILGYNKDDNGDRRPFRLEAYVNDGSPFANKLYDSARPGVKMEYVQAVSASLPKLVSMLRVVFPTMEARLRPLLLLGERARQPLDP